MTEKGNNRSIRGLYNKLKSEGEPKVIWFPLTFYELERTQHIVLNLVKYLYHIAIGKMILKSPGRPLPHVL